VRHRQDADVNGAEHAHADGAPYSAIAMCPPHLVLKWAGEVLIAVHD
jgi:hypothetical protein